MKELRDNLIGRGCIDVLTEKETTWKMQKEALSYFDVSQTEAVWKTESSWMR